MNATKLLITSALAASLTIGAGAALAQDDPQPDAPSTQEMPGRFGNRNFFGPQRPGGAFRLGGIGRELIEEYTGLDLVEVREALRAGQTLAELIEANGQSVDDFIAEAVAAGSERIDTAVANMTERAETLKSTLAERITARVNGERYEPPAAEAPEATEEASA